MISKIPTWMLVMAIIMGVFIGIILSTELHKNDCYTIEYRNAETNEVVKSQRICVSRGEE